jgi:hypothetical protein
MCFGALVGATTAGPRPCDSKCGPVLSPVVTTADFDQLSESEKRHFYKCAHCGKMVDMRQLDDVLFHETNHKPRPDIQYGGSQSLGVVDSAS